jgi:hypothetical protein
MKQILEQWFDRNGNVPGVLAFAVQYPDQTNSTQKCAPNITAEALDNAWRCVIETIPVLAMNNFPTARVRWVYEGGIVHCERRRDGLCLAIFASKDATSVNAGELDRLLAEFHAL